MDRKSQQNCWKQSSRIEEKYRINQKIIVKLFDLSILDIFSGNKFVFYLIFRKRVAALVLTMSTSRCADGIFFGTEQEKIYPVGSTQTTSGDSTLLSIDCMAVESEVASTMCQQSEMDC